MTHDATASLADIIEILKARYGVEPVAILLRHVTEELEREVAAMHAAVTVWDHEATEMIK